nr:MAG TPA: hypothetical protein [Caudoviricetes sp.]
MDGQSKQYLYNFGCFQSYRQRKAATRLLRN